MRFLSLFSGIEAASCAWLPLGWECVGVAEIEKFPCSVLAHHYPDVPNLGDITKITKEQVEALGRIDLVVGGFPCQDLSIAGKRRGLKNDDGSNTRSGLFFEAMRVVRWSGARLLLLENVPGIYSSHGGRDFASMVGEILGVGFDVPADGWQNTGVAASERGLLEWATLDAQWFGVPQRRRRMFALADFGDWRSRPPVLFERHSLSGDTPPGREKGQEVTGTIGARTTAGGGFGGDFETTGGLQPVLANTHTLPGRGFNDVHSSSGYIAHCLNAGGMGRQDYETETLITHSLRGEGFDASEDGTGRGTPLVPVQPYTLAIRGRGDSHNLEYRQDGTANALLTPNGGRGGIGVGAVAFAQNTQDEVRMMHVAGALAAEPGMKQQTYIAQSAIAWSEELTASIDCAGTIQRGGDGGRHDGVMTSNMQVRRLTPRECERLQGFPDDYTLMPGRVADGPRYKALGNSMAVPVMRWIGARIEEVQTLAIKDVA